MKCTSCDMELSTDDFYVDDINGNPICETCEHSAWEYSNIVTAINSDGVVTKFHWCSTFGFRDEHYDEIPGGHPDGVIDWVWKSTGHRGYSQPILQDGYISIMDGWVTGDWDDVQYKHKFHNFSNALISGKVIPPIPVIFASGLTTNVFSSTMDVVIRAVDNDAFVKWVYETFEFSLNDLINALS